MCIIFSWLKNAVLLKKMCRSELWFSRNGFGHSCRAGRPGPNRERCRRGLRNDSAVCRPSTPDARRRGLVQPPWAYMRPSGSLRCVIASVCACMTRSTALFDALPVQNVQNVQNGTYRRIESVTAGALTLKVRYNTEEVVLCVIPKNGCVKCYSHGFYTPVSLLCRL